MSEHYKVVTGNVLVGSEMISHLITDSTCEKKFKLVNGSDKSIWICASDGSITHLKPSLKHPYRRSLIIVHETYPGNNNLGWIESYEDQDLTKIANGSNKSGRVEWEEEISLEEITKHRNGVYLRTCDLVITTDIAVAGKLHHPKCIQKIHNDYLAATAVGDLNSIISISIRIIDNEGLSGTQFTVFQNKVMAIQPIVETNLKDGLYICGFVDVDSRGIRTTRMDEYYSFKEVEEGKSPIKLYKSFILAADARDKPTIKEKEIADAISKREHDQIITRMKMDHDLESLSREKVIKELEVEISTRDAKLAEAKANRDNDLHDLKHKRQMEAELYQMQLNQLKMQQELTSNNSKAVVELIKTIGLVAGGIIALKTILKK